jgi:hypothetical protein
LAPAKIFLNKEAFPASLNCDDSQGHGYDEIICQHDFFFAAVISDHVQGRKDD